MADELKGKVAVVTGAGRGIGAAIATGYAQAGATVVCVSRTDAEVQSVASAIVGRGGQAFAIAANVADPALLRLVPEASEHISRSSRL